MNIRKKFTTLFGKFYVIAIIIIVLIAARIALPYVVLHYANKNLANSKTLYGHINDIDIALYRGAYRIHDIYINKKDSASGKQTTFLKADLIDVSVEWSALFRGRLVGELAIERPTLIFTKDKTEPKDIEKDSLYLITLFNDFMPLKLNSVLVNNGVIKYVDQTSKPAVNVEMNNTYVLAQNLSSVVDSALLPSTIKASAKVYGGTLQFVMKLNALKEHHTFDLNANVNNIRLPELNNFLRAYANIDVNKGTLAIYTEIAAKDGKFIGYVKPIIKDLDVVGKEDRNDSFWQKAWESIVGAAGIVLSNPKKEQIASKLPISGTFDNSESDTWYAVINLLKNAFIQALKPSLDNAININSVKR